MQLDSYLSYISTIVAIGAAIFAGFSAHQAKIANKEAEKANKIAEDANKISKQALELQERQAPAHWSEIMKAEKNSYFLKNNSGKDATITEIKAIPEETAGWLVSGPLPRVVSDGDSFKFKLAGDLGVQMESIKIKWYFENDPEEHEIVRNVN